MSERHDAEVEQVIESALSTDAFALYGAGQLGKMTMNMWPKACPKPLFFVDAHKTGPYCDLPVYPPDGDIPDGVTFLLSAFKMPPVAAKSVFEKLGQSQLLTVYDFFQKVMPDEFGNGWRNLDPDDATRAKLECARSVYADNLSKHVHDCAAAWRYQREMPDDYPVAPEEDKYNLSGLGRSGFHYDLVIDGGSYDLHALDMLAEGGVGWERAIAIEADPARAEFCRRNAGGRAQVIETAIADFDGEADFLATGLLSARLAAPALTGDNRLVSVPVSTLDKISEAFGPLADKRLLLKLHIEGAELAALKGAETLLTSARCDILLNLSHDEKSFLDLPVYLESFDRFDIFLRSHSLFGEGLTLFARYKDNL